MSIRDFIERKKAEFFVAKDADKAQLQKDILAKERAELAAKRADIESIRKAQDEVRQEKQALRAAQMAPLNGFLGRAKSGFQNLQENVKKFDNDQPKQKGSNSPFFSSGPAGIQKINESPMSSSGLFATGGPAGIQTQSKKPKSQGKTITIRVN